MATTAAHFVTKLRFASASQSAGRTEAHFVYSLRMVAGLYSGGGGFSRPSSRLRKSLKPDRRSRMVDANGFITEEWDRYFDDIDVRRLGGATASTLPDIQSNLVSVQGTTATVAAAIPAIIQTVQANAASQQAANQVQQDAGTPGADQIPAPVLTVPEPVPSTPRTQNNL